MSDFPDYKTVSTDSLIPYARNSRTHSDEQVAQIAASIREFGFLNPIIVDGDNGILAGHGRVMAAQKLGMESLPCIEASHLTDAQRKAYIIADNKLALNSGWDDDMLKIELQDLMDSDFRVDLVGFDEDELNLIFNGWDSDIDVVEKDGQHEEGILASIKVKVDQSAEQFTKETVTNALDAAGIDYELG